MPHTPREYRESSLQVSLGRCYCCRPKAPPAAGREETDRVRTAGREPSSAVLGPCSGAPLDVAVWRELLPFSGRHVLVGATKSVDAKQVWRAALGELQVLLSPANFETWLKETALVTVDDNRFTVAVPNGFAKDWLETRYRSLISQTLARVVGYSVQVDFEVREGLTGVLAEDAQQKAATDGSAPQMTAVMAPVAQHVRLEPGRVGGPDGGSLNLNPRYTFRNFIVGSANRLAHAASLSVAERPGHAYN